MKGKKNADNSSLSKTHMQNIEFLSFLYEDFLPKHSYKDIKIKPIVEVKDLLVHVCSQYKTLLELPIHSFWATVAYNAYFNRSLDSFLAFARRPHINILDVPTSDENAAMQDFDIDLLESKKQLEPYYNELYRDVLLIYHRLSTEHKSSHSAPIDYGKIVYDNWLFDIAKLLDICAIYQHNNPVKVKNIVQNVFMLNDSYKDDFLELIELLFDDLIPNNMKIMNRHRIRNDLDAITLKADTEEKEKILILLYDIMEHLKSIVNFFPKNYREDIFYHKKALLVLENTYISLKDCAKSWRILETKVDPFKSLVKKINDDIIYLVDTLFNHVFADFFAGKPAFLKNKKPWKQLGDFLAMTGRTTSKKKDDEPIFKFLRRLVEGVDFEEILKKVPENFIKTDDVETYQVNIMVLKEKTEELKNKRNRREEEEELEAGESQEANVIKSVSSQKDQKVTVQPPVNKEVKKEAEKKEEKIDKESKETQEAIKIIEMTIGKKDRSKNFFDEDEARDAMLATLKLAANTNVYDDEYDDTLEMYEEDRFRVQGDKAEDEEEDNSDTEEASVEGELTKDELQDGKQRGGKKPYGRRNEEQQQQQRGGGGYSYKPRNQDYRKPYEGQGRPYESRGEQSNREQGSYYKGGQAYTYQKKDEGGREDKGGYYQKKNTEFNQEQGGGYSYSSGRDYSNKDESTGGFYGKSFGGGQGGYDPKRENRNTHNDRQRYKQKNKSGQDYEYVKKN